MTKSMDRKLVAAKQRHEIAYICKKFKVKRSSVLTAIHIAGRSRAKVYAALRVYGYQIPTRKFPKG